MCINQLEISPYRQISLSAKSLEADFSSFSHGEQIVENVSKSSGLFSMKSQLASC